MVDTHTHTLRNWPSWGLVHGADRGTEGHKKKQRGSKKEREMSFK